MSADMEFEIMRILKENSPGGRALCQSEIAGLLYGRTGHRPDRKTLRRALGRLSGNEPRLKCRQRDRVNERSGWYLEEVFSEKEREMLADSVVKNPDLPEEECLELLKRLDGVSGGFEDGYGWLCSAGRGRTKFRSVKERLDIIRRAIDERMMLTFSIVVYEKKGRLRLRRDSSGQVRQYLVRPCAVVCADGKYKLLGAIGDTDFYAYFTVESMYALEMTDIRSVGSAGPGREVYPASRAEDVRPKTSEKIKVTVLAKQNALEEIYEAYGSGAELIREKGDKTALRIETEPEAFERWALRLGSDVEVVDPPKMRRSISARLREMLLMYSSVK